MLSQAPSVARTALWHTLSLSPTSAKLDLRTEIIVSFIRSILASPSPHGVLKQQRMTIKDPGIKGKVWISKVTIPTPEDDAQRLLLQAIEDFKTSSPETYAAPSTVPVEAEWTGYRPNVDPHRQRPCLSEQQHFDRLMADTKGPITILYFHGGVFFMMDPASHRDPVSNLARLTGGRALNVRYRLAPQNAFPSALLDAFISYLYLLYPPPGSYHEPVSPAHIVLAGDSAGGNLALSLIQLLLQINRRAANQNDSQTSFRFHEHNVPLPLRLPAGVATHSPWLDMTHCMPSKIYNQEYDYLPAPPTRERVSTFPHDEAWPTKPPRGDLYCDTSMLCHPLVSPLAAEDWSGAPPLWLCYGQEMLVDEGKQVAALASSQGVQVVWEEWEAMSHCFGMILGGTPISKKYFANWADFIRGVCGVGGGEGDNAKPITKGTFFEAMTLKERQVEVAELAVLGRVEVERRMRVSMEVRHLNPQDAEKVVPKL